MSENILVERTLEHFEAVRTKDLAGILSLYERSDDLLVFVEGPRWRTLGYKMVEKGWTDFMDSSISVTKAEWIDALRFRVAGDMGFVGGINELTVNIGGKEQTIKFRGTFIFQKDSEGEWKVVLEHFSQPAADPYGVGDWLKH